MLKEVMNDRCMHGVIPYPLVPIWGSRLIGLGYMYVDLFFKCTLSVCVLGPFSHTQTLFSGPQTSFLFFFLNR